MDCPWADSGYRANNWAIGIALSNSGDVRVFMQSTRDLSIQALLSNLYKDKRSIRGRL